MDVVDNNGSAINRGVLEIRWKEEKKICYTRFVIYSTTSKSTIRGIFRFFPRFENFFASGCISISDPFENLQYYDLGRIRLEKRPRRVSKEKKEKRNETRKLKKLSFENQKCEKKGKKSNQSSTIELYSPLIEKEINSKTRESPSELVRWKRSVTPRYPQNKDWERRRGGRVSLKTHRLGLSSLGRRGVCVGRNLRFRLVNRWLTCQGRQPTQTIRRMHKYKSPLSNIT